MMCRDGGDHAGLPSAHGMKIAEGVPRSKSPGATTAVAVPAPTPINRGPRPRLTMSEMSAPPITAQYAALVAAGEIEEDPAQEEVVAKLARLNERLAMHRLGREEASLGSLVRPEGRPRAGPQGALHLGRRRARQDHADGHVLRRLPGAAKAAGAFPPIHARRAGPPQRLSFEAQGRGDASRRPHP